MHRPRDSPIEFWTDGGIWLWRINNKSEETPVAIDPNEQAMEELQDIDISDIHVSLKRVDNVVDEAKYHLYFLDYSFKRNNSNGNVAVSARFKFDADRHPQYEKRTQRHDFWLTPDAMWRYTQFLVCAGINPEMLREEPVTDPQTGAIVMNGNQPATKCVYSVKEQLDSIAGAPVYADIANEEYTAKALDGITDEIRKTSKIQQFTKA